MTKPINILFTGQSLDERIRLYVPEEFNVIVLPFIETKLIDDQYTINLINDLLIEHSQIIITSNIAAQWLIKHVKMKPTWGIACMEGKTQELFNQNNWTNIILSSAQSSEDLAIDAAEKFKKNKPIYFLTGNKHLNTVPAYLYKCGFDIQTIEVYQTINMNQKIEVEYDGIVFLSPSAVLSFFTYHTINSKIPIFTIGATTAKAAKHKVNNPIIVSPKVTQQSLFNTIYNFY